jgi:uncharacterized protein (DUF885 family)
LDFDRWSDSFANEWMSERPQSSTRTQYFDGAKQDDLDRRLALEDVYGGVYGMRAARARSALAQRGLDELAKFDRAALRPDQQTSAAILESHLRDAVAAESFAQHRFIFNSFIGLHLSLVTFLATMHPVRNARDAENYIVRLGLVSGLFDDAIAEAGSAQEAGFVPPDFILQRSIGQLDELIGAPPEQNPLVATFKHRLASVNALTEDRRRSLVDEASEIVRSSIVPALTRVRELLRGQLQHANSDAGAWRLPRGAEYYAHALATITGTALTPQEIHAIGLREVARIEAEMDAILKEFDLHDGSIRERIETLNARSPYADNDEVRQRIVRDLQSIVDDAELRSRSLFDLLPKAPVVVQREPSYSEKSAAAHYTTPAPDGTRPGIYWVPLADLGPAVQWLGIGTKSTVYHEAIPGHHYQLALQQELPDLPRFRKFGAFGFDITYVEGWALYAEHIAAEAGWYEGDSASRLGYLQMQLFRARRLVVDTGLHAMRWTRAQAIDYGFTAAEVDRYVCWPGQACAYMIGFLRILELREAAKSRLGDAFSIKDFHNVVLRGGEMPLKVLAGEVERGLR